MRRRSVLLIIKSMHIEKAENDHVTRSQWHETYRHELYEFKYFPGYLYSKGSNSLHAVLPLFLLTQSAQDILSGDLGLGPVSDLTWLVIRSDTSRESSERLSSESVSILLRSITLIVYQHTLLFKKPGNIRNDRIFNIERKIKNFLKKIAAANVWLRLAQLTSVVLLACCFNKNHKDEPWQLLLQNNFSISSWFTIFSYLQTNNSSVVFKYVFIKMSHNLISYYE